MKSEPRKLVSLARMAGEGAQAKKHSHPEFSGRQLRLDGYWRDGSTGVTTLKRVAISYNMEDDTMSVKVLADKKRGLTEMTILKNHLVPNPLTGDEYTWRDLGPGSDVNLFGRYIHIVSADKASRMILDRQAKSEGLYFRDNEELPQELRPSLTSSDEAQRVGKRDDPGRRFMLARMGIVDRQLEDVAKFMQYDGQVLNFKCVWDDPSMGHEGLRDFELKYYLVDDSVVVQEVGPRKDLDQKGPLVKRLQLPKKFNWAAQDLRPLAPGSYDEMEYLTLDDLEVGSTIDVLGRRMRIYDMDQPSRQLARELLSREFAPATGAPPQISASKLNAWGQPLKDPSQAAAKRASQPWAGRRDTLSYGLKLLSRSREDDARRFTMTLNVANNEVSLTEVANVELGIAGGKILAPVEVPFVEVDSDFYTGPTRWQGVGVAPEMASLARRLGPVDCVVGARVNILGTNYKIISADVATHSFMEDFPQYFPCSHGDNLMRRLQAQMASISAQEMMAAAQGLDPAGTGVIPPQLFTQFLNFFNFDLSEQEQQALARKFSGGESGGVQLGKLLAELREA